ncbi:MAG TPA: hypothetical protein EYP68_01580 [Candidatus Korarchaeota archaeon]|nr:hypothetical protein [Candidatus Korarchaeota archaeon]
MCLNSIVFIIATIGDIPADIDNLLHDPKVQEMLLMIERKESVNIGYYNPFKRLREIGLISEDALSFPLILKEDYERIASEIGLMVNEVSELVSHGLSGLAEGSKEILSVAALGELDTALDDFLLGRVNAMKLDSGEAIFCGFEGAIPMAYRSWCDEKEEGFVCTIEVGEPRSVVCTSIDANSPIYAGSKQMADLAEGVIEWCLPEANVWADDLDLTGLRRDMFLYGSTKLIYNKSMVLLKERGEILWDVTLRYMIKGL